jgi:hypothetical protein
MAQNYHAGETITSGPYKGFVVFDVSKGWYTVYHPSNVTGDEIPIATTKIRWRWANPPNSPRRYVRTPEELSTDDQQTLLTGNITKVEQIGDTWRDDHIDCVAVRVHVDGRKIEVSLWWCGPAIIGALRYAGESPKAMADVLRELRNSVQMSLGQ